MPLATLGPRVNVHPQRMGATKSGLNRLLVIHDSEGSEGIDSAERLATYIASPGDRPQPGRENYGSSYHYVVDTDRVIPAVPEDVVAYSASGANHDGIHICIPGTARQTRDEWLDAISRAYVGQTARILVDRSRETGIPLKRLTVSQVRDGVSSGYCSHHDVSLAFGKSTHTDPGPNFPWDILAADITALTRPPAPVPGPTPAPGVPDMSQAQALIQNDIAVFVQYDGWKAWLPEGPDVPMFNDLRVLNGEPPLPTNNLTGNKAAMHALGPIVGPVPKGWDAWGAKL